MPANIDKLLHSTVNSDKLKPTEKCAELEIIFSLNERYKKRNAARSQAAQMPTLQLNFQVGRTCVPRDEKANDTWLYLTMPSHSVLNRDLTTLSKLADHGYPLEQALFIAFYSESEGKSTYSEIVRFLLAYNPEINLNHKEDDGITMGGRASTLSAAKKRLTEQTLHAYTQLTEAMKLFSNLPSFTAKKSKENKSVEKTESKALATIKKPDAYSEVYPYFLKACGHDSTFVITYLAMRLKNMRTGKEQAENNPYLVDFTKQAIKLLSPKTFCVSSTHNHLVNTLLSEWQMHADYAEILAYYAIICRGKKENIAAYVADCLDSIRSKKNPEYMTLFLFDFTKQVFNLLDAKAAVGLPAYQFLVDIILKEWDVDPLNKSWAFGAEGTTRREFLTSLFNDHKDTVDAWKDFLTSLADGKLPIENLDNPKNKSLPIQGLDVTLPEEKAVAPLSPHRRLSILAAAPPVQMVSDATLAVTPSQQCA